MSTDTPIEKEALEGPLRERLRRMRRVYTAVLGLAWDVARARATGLFALMILLGLFGSVGALVTRYVVDALTVGERGPALLWAGLFLGHAAGNALLNRLLMLLQFDMAERISQSLDQRLMSISVGAPGIEHLEHPEFADKMKLVRERSYIPYNFLGNLASVAYMAFGLGSAMILLGLIHPLLIVTPLISAPSAYLQYRSLRKHYRKHDETAIEERYIEHYLDLATRAEPAKEVRIFGLVDELVRRHKALTDEYVGKLVRDRLKRSGIGLATGGAYGGAMAAAIGFIGWLAIEGRVSFGEVAMGVQVARMAVGQMQMAGNLFAWLAELAFMGERYMWLLDYEPSVRAKPAGEAVPAPDQIRTGIAFEGVGFIYPGTDKRALEDVNLVLPAGSTVALVGENGAGKSSLVKLLSRFYDPTEGRITVDGVDLRDIDLDGWREQIGVAYQDFVRFQLIAREVIGLGDLAGIDDHDRVHAAARHAGADRVVDTLPTGYDNQLGREFPEGTDLSEGQWQRMAIARGLMRQRPALVMLDEPTAALDARAESEVFERFHEMARGVGSYRPVTLLVSHRFSTVRMAELIVVLHEGRIEEIGTHDELMDAGGRYADLFRLQASRYT